LGGRAPLRRGAHARGRGGSAPSRAGHAVIAYWSVYSLGVTGVVRPLACAPATVLATAGDPVDPQDRDILQLAADLVATMRVSPGCVGLAAPQVGVSAQVFAVDVTGHPKARTTHG